MYSDAELDAAVTEGAISAEAAASLRAFVARRQASPMVDEEHFRLLTGFNDVFVSIAAILMLVAVGWLAGLVSPAAGCVAVSVVSWALAEYFTRRRRMALPSILLLTSFAGGLYAVGFVGAAMAMPAIAETPRMAAGAAMAVLGTIAHWSRFRVPITVAVGACSAVASAVMLLVATIPGLGHIWTVPVLAGGLSLFALAMRWDMSDRTRTTRRSDVAFWLHLAAAPAIVHPTFSLLGLLGRDETDLSSAVMAMGVYLVLTGVALVVDRRALLVSALFYVLYAISALLRAAGALSASLALTALVVGSALLLLSAFWHPARRVLLGVMPGPIRARTPVI